MMMGSSKHMGSGSVDQFSDGSPSEINVDPCGIKWEHIGDKNNKELLKAKPHRLSKVSGGKLAATLQTITFVIFGICAWSASANKDEAEFILNKHRERYSSPDYNALLAEIRQLDESILDARINLAERPEGTLHCPPDRFSLDCDTTIPGELQTLISRAYEESKCHQNAREYAKLANRILKARLQIDGCRINEFEHKTLVFVSKRQDGEQPYDHTMRVMMGKTLLRKKCGESAWTHHCVHYVRSKTGFDHLHKFIIDGDNPKGICVNLDEFMNDWLDRQNVEILVIDPKKYDEWTQESDLNKDTLSEEIAFWHGFEWMRCMLNGEKSEKRIDGSDAGAL